MIDTSKAVASSVELRKLCLKLAFHAGDNAAHLGGALSCTDFISVILNIFDFKTPESFNSFILSKGHACLIFYASLIYNQVVTFDDVANSFEKDKSKFLGHPCKNEDVGILFSTGSLGNGLSHAAGMALYKKRTGDISPVVAIVGDGECNEGIVWESLDFIARESLNNMIIFIDCNGWQQTQTSLLSTNNYNNLALRLESYPFAFQDLDGHSHQAISNFLITPSNKPKLILGRTVKGKGVSFAENNNQWHHSIMTQQLLEQSLLELSDS
jgi:transketolase